MANAHPPIRWQLYPVSEFARLKQAWDELNLKQGGSALLSSRFIEPCLEHFCAAEVKLAIATSNELQQPVAATLIERIGLGRWQTLQPSQAPIGFWLSDPAIDFETLLAELAKALPGWVLSISITQQDPELLPRPSAMQQLTTLDYITTGRLVIPEDFQQYWQQRGKNVRQNINKSKNRLQREGISVTFEIADDPASVRQYVAEFGDLESAGWKRETGTAVHIDNVQGRFYTQLLEAFMPDQCQIWRYRFDEQLVAVDLCLCVDGVLYILKTTYDEAFKRYSPAFMMHLAGIEALTEQSVERIEFYGPAMEWHKKLTQELRTMYHITWFSHPLIQQLKQLRAG